MSLPPAEEVNERGGKQSALDTRCDLLPPDAILQVAAILKRGASSYGLDNWRKIDRRDHINHALTHIFKYLSGDTSETHLANATCRMMFALETKDGDV
jgi:hypothetical protein